MPQVHATPSLPQAGLNREFDSHANRLFNSICMLADTRPAKGEVIGRRFAKFCAQIRFATPSDVKPGEVARGHICKALHLFEMVQITTAHWQFFGAAFHVDAGRFIFTAHHMADHIQIHHHRAMHLHKQLSVELIE